MHVSGLKTRGERKGEADCKTLTNGEHGCGMSAALTFATVRSISVTVRNHIEQMHIGAAQCTHFRLNISSSTGNVRGDQKVGRNFLHARIGRWSSRITCRTGRTDSVCTWRGGGAFLARGAGGMTTARQASLPRTTKVSATRAA